MIKKICVIIGSRANYSSIKSVMSELETDKDFELQIILTTSSVLNRYGNVSTLIKKDGFRVNEEIYNLIEGENTLTMAKSTGLAVIEIANTFQRLSPDLVIVIGDRFEVMATAISASYMNIPIAHTMGGEVSGTIDESLRHAITKLSHIHFPATKKSAKRIEKLGEISKNIFCVGCPRIDYVKSVLLERKSISEKIFSTGVGNRFNLSENFIICSFHPVTTEFSDAKNQVRIILDVLDQFNINSIILWPNADAGSSEIATEIRKYRENNKLQKSYFFKNLPTDIYIRLLDKCSAIIGNSSSGIREGSYIGVPCVNVGTRQNFREKDINVVDVNFQYEEIRRALKSQVNIGKYKKGNLYGDGNAASKIIKILKKIKRIDIQKRITY